MRHLVAALALSASLVSAQTLLTLHKNSTTSGMPDPHTVTALVSPGNGNIPTTAVKPCVGWMISPASPVYPELDIWHLQTSFTLAVGGVPTNREVGLTFIEITQPNRAGVQLPTCSGATWYLDPGVMILATYLWRWHSILGVPGTATPPWPSWQHGYVVAADVTMQAYITVPAGFDMSGNSITMQSFYLAPMLASGVGGNPALANCDVISPSLGITPTDAVTFTFQ